MPDSSSGQPPKKRGTAKGRATRKGIPNKRTQQAREIADALGVDPLVILLHIANGNWKALGYKSAQHIVAYSMSGKPIYEDVIKMDHRERAASRAMPFLHAVRRAEDSKGKVSDTPELPPPSEPAVIENHYVIKQVVAAGTTAATEDKPVENVATEKEVKDVVSVCYDPQPLSKKA